MTIPSSLITLVIVMNPFGNIPVIAAMLKNIPKERHFKLMLRESIFALALLLIFTTSGSMLLSFLNLTHASINVAGGLILFLIAIKMIFPATGTDKASGQVTEPFIVPIATPLIAGPSSLALVILIGTQGATEIQYPLTAVAIAWIVNSIILMTGLHFSKFLGQKGLAALERLMGMLLTTIAVQMLLSGIKNFFS